MWMSGDARKRIEALERTSAALQQTLAAVSEALSTLERRTSAVEHDLETFVGRLEGAERDAAQPDTKMKARIDSLADRLDDAGLHLSRLKADLVRVEYQAAADKAEADRVARGLYERIEAPRIGANRERDRAKHR